MKPKKDSRAATCSKVMRVAAFQLRFLGAAGFFMTHYYCYLLGWSALIR